MNTTTEQVTNEDKLRVAQASAKPKAAFVCPVDPAELAQCDSCQ